MFGLNLTYLNNWTYLDPFPWATGEEVANIAFGIVHWALDAVPFIVGIDIGAGMG